MAALELLPEMHEQREAVFRQANEIRHRLSKAGLDTGGSTSQIVPILLSSSKEALDWSRSAVDAGFYVQAIRPPTVRQSRLRLTVCHGIGEEAWDRFGTWMEQLHGE